jgi:hypothetical protein
MANSLFWGATAGSGCLLTLYILAGAYYPAADNPPAPADPGTPAGRKEIDHKMGSRKKTSKRGEGGKDAVSSNTPRGGANKSGSRREGDTKLTGGSGAGATGEGKLDSSGGLEGSRLAGENDWLILHMDRILGTPNLFAPAPNMLIYNSWSVNTHFRGARWLCSA